MVRPIVLGGFLLGTTLALNHQQQQPLPGPFYDNKGDDKPLIDSDALQDLIKPENLLKRAEELYEIAKLSENDWNHPTRVIGSAGRLNKSTGTATTNHLTVCRSSRNLGMDLQNHVKYE